MDNESFARHDATRFPSMVSPLPSPLLLSFFEIKWKKEVGKKKKKQRYLFGPPHELGLAEPIQYSNRRPQLYPFPSSSPLDQLSFAHHTQPRCHACQLRLRPSPPTRSESHVGVPAASRVVSHVPCSTPTTSGACCYAPPVVLPLPFQLTPTNLLLPSFKTMSSGDVGCRSVPARPPACAQPPVKRPAHRGEDGRHCRDACCHAPPAMLPLPFRLTPTTLLLTMSSGDGGCRSVPARPPAAATGLRPAAWPTRRGEDGRHCGDARGILAAIEDRVRGRCAGFFLNRYFDLWVVVVGNFI
jgi:hypothetical protein